MSFAISQGHLDKLQETREIDGVYLANSLQQGFILHSIRQGNVDDAYIIQGIWEYHNKLDISKLKEAWMYAQKKYPSLRLRLVWEEELLQVVDKEGSLDWRYIDLSKEKDAQVRELKIEQIQGDDRSESYRLELGNLFRVYLIKQQEDLYTCIFSNHHAILDGWSSSVLLSYVHETYLKLVKWLNATNEINAVLVSAVAQFQLVHIHPFLDVMAELLACLQLSVFIKEVMTLSVCLP